MGIFKKLDTFATKALHNTIAFFSSKKDKEFTTFDTLGFYLQSQGYMTEEYKQHSWVYGAVSLIASNISSVSFLLTGNSQYLAQFENLFMSPNSMQSYAQFMQYVMINLELKGEIYLYLYGRTSIQDVPKYMFPIDSEIITPIIENSRLTGYKIDTGNKQGTTILPKEIPFWQMIRIYYVNPYKYGEALAPLSAAKYSINQDYKATLYNLSFFENGAFPGAVLKYNQFLSETEYDLIVEKWKERHKGVNKAFELGILEGGADLTTVNIPHKDAEFLLQKKWNRDEILGVFGVPKALLGVYDDVNYATFLGAKKQLWRQTLFPKLKLLEATFNSFLLNYYGIRGFYDVEGIADLQDSYTEKLEWATKLFNLGVPINTINDKFKLGLPPIVGGDRGYLPSNMVLTGSNVASVETPNKLELENLLKEL